MFEVPSIVYMTLKSWEKENDKAKINLGKSLLIGAGGVIFVGICSYISLFLDKISDGWFSCLVFCILWTFIFIKLLAELIKNREKISLSNKKDWTLIIFWFAIYGYCICGLIKLGIVQVIPIYGIFAVFLFILTMILNLINI